MNFSNFTKQDFGDDKKSQKAFSQKDAVDSYNQLKNLSSDELSKRLFEEVAKQKQQGTFNYDMLISSIESIKGMIPQKTYQNLKSLVESLKW